jgi:ubiquinone/menaquinone biosynthesis C-methylase UbiE
MSSAPKPRHLAPDYATQFCDRSVVRAYVHRPPYPAHVFDALRDLLPEHKGNALELGCGNGDLTFRLAPHVQELVAVEASPAMLAAAIRRHESVPRHVRLVLAKAEAFEPREKFSLVVAAESLHWMDWEKVLPNIARWLRPEGWLALVSVRQFVSLPWESELRPIIGRYSTNQDYKRYDLVELLSTRGLFVEHGRTEAVEPAFVQSVESYVESFHSRNGFSRERMSADAATAFDDVVRALVLQHSPSGEVRGDVAATVVWGRPTP